MTVAVLYSGFLRSWEQCKANQLENIGMADHFFYTFEQPEVPYTQFIRIPGMYYPYLPEHPYTLNKNPFSSVDSTLNQWHHQYINFCLVPTGYDIYIKSRPDITLSGPIDFSLYPLDDHTIYIPYGNDHYDGVNDQFAFGSYEVMKKYFSVYINHQYIFAAGVPFHPEGYVTKNLEREGVSIVRLPITNTIVR